MTKRVLARDANMHLHIIAFHLTRRQCALPRARHAHLPFIRVDAASRRTRSARRMLLKGWRTDHSMQETGVSKWAMQTLGLKVGEHSHRYLVAWGWCWHWLVRSRECRASRDPAVVIVEGGNAFMTKGAVIRVCWCSIFSVLLVGQVTSAVNTRGYGTWNWYTTSPPTNCIPELPVY